MAATRRRFLPSDRGLSHSSRYFFLPFRPTDKSNGERGRDIESSVSHWQTYGGIQTSGGEDDEVDDGRMETIERSRFKV